MKASLAGTLCLVVGSSIAAPATAQNMLANADFSAGLYGWGVTQTVDPGSEASVTAVQDDAGRDAGTGGARFHLRMLPPALEGWVMIAQCRPAPGGPLAFGARVRVDRQVKADLFVSAEFFDTLNCAGNRVGNTDVKALQSSGGMPISSEGRWLYVSGVVDPLPGARSVGFKVSVDEFLATSIVELDALVDDAYLIPASDRSSLWIVPSLARWPGVGGNLWASDVTLANTSSTEGVATLKFLGNGIDGRAGIERDVYVPAGQVVGLRDVLGDLFGVSADFGALRILATPGIAAVSETWTSSNGGSVGESLPPAGPGDFIGTAPRSLFPVRENQSFRTNLHLVNATESQVVVELRLFSLNGAQIGVTGIVALAPLEMLQLNRVVNLLGVSSVDGGRLTVSARTPGGLLAAYASVIDNVTNDPRTLLPR